MGMPVTIPLLCAADDRYSLPLGIMLYSAARNCSVPLEIFLLDAGISADNQARIRRVLAPLPAKLNWVKPDDRNLRGLPTSSHLPISAYYRLLASEVLPADAPKVLYVDADVLVDADLQEIWELSVDDHYVLASVDRKRTIGVSPLAKCPGLSYGPDDKYFNSGVLVMNLDTIRRENVFEQAITFMRRWPSYIQAADQDGLNAVSIGRWGSLDPRWNWFVKDHPNEDVRNVLFHYMGANKPWLPDKGRGWGPSHHLWVEYLTQSGWFLEGEQRAAEESRARADRFHRAIGTVRSLFGMARD